MKKLCAIISFLVIFFKVGFPQTAVWSDDFEGNWILDWQVSGAVWEVDTPSNVGPENVYDGGKCACTIADGNYPSTMESRLSTIQSITVPPASNNPRLRFWHWFDFGNTGTADGYGVVEIKNNVGPWTEISRHYINKGSKWTRPTFDLRPFAGQQIFISFYASGGNSNSAAGWYIDDVEIVEGPIVYNDPETFENGYGDWCIDNGSWEIGVPTSGPDSTHGGINCAATVLDGDYHNTMNSTLISPEFIVPSADLEPRLIFWHWYQFSNTGVTDGSGSVEVKTNDGDWHVIEGPIINSSGGNWTVSNLDLLPFADSLIQIGFFASGGSSGAAPGWYIDDIDIIGLSTNLNDIEKQNRLFIYPLPARSIFYVKTDELINNSQIQIYDLFGKSIFIEKVVSNPQAVDIDLPSGVYFLKVGNPQTEIIKKLVIN